MPVGPGYVLPLNGHSCCFVPPSPHLLARPNVAAGHVSSGANRGTDGTLRGLLLRMRKCLHTKGR